MGITLYLMQELNLNFKAFQREHYRLLGKLDDYTIPGQSPSEGRRGGTTPHLF